MDGHPVGSGPAKETLIKANPALNAAIAGAHWLALHFIAGSDL